MKTCAFLSVAGFLMLSACKGPQLSPQPSPCDQAWSDFPDADNALVFMPNAFTPNGDGLNETLAVQGIHLASLDYKLYNENFQQVFHTTTPGEGFRPATLSAGAAPALYHYRITATSNAGNTITLCGTAYSLRCIPEGWNAAALIFPDQYNAMAPDGYQTGTSGEQLGACP